MDNCVDSNNPIFFASKKQNKKKKKKDGIMLSTTRIQNRFTRFFRRIWRNLIRPGVSGRQISSRSCLKSSLLTLAIISIFFIAIFLLTSTLFMHQVQTDVQNGDHDAGFFSGLDQEKRTDFDAKTKKNKEVSSENELVKPTLEELPFSPPGAKPKNGDDKDDSSRSKDFNGSSLLQKIIEKEEKEQALDSTTRSQFKAEDLAWKYAEPGNMPETVPELKELVQSLRRRKRDLERELAEGEDRIFPENKEPSFSSASNLLD